MTGQQSKPCQYKHRTAHLSLIVLAACLTTPVLAASPNTIPCDEADVATLEIPLLELSVRTLHHEISIAKIDDIAAATEKDAMPHEFLLKPQAQEAIRKAFVKNPKAEYTSRSTLDADAADEDDTPARESSGLNTRLPGVSDDHQSLYKKRMYRRDI